MTLRYGHDGKPIGLDWDVCNDGNPQPELWGGTLRSDKPKEPKAVKISPVGSTNNNGQRIASEKEQEIIRLYTEEEMSGSQISKLVGCTVTTVFKSLHRNGVPMRGKHARQVEAE